MRTLRTVVLCVLVLGAAASTLRAQDALSEQKKAQNKLLALRAARVDAMRKLAERINGLFITSSTKVKDFVTESDDIQTAMQAWLSGMREVGKPKYMEDGTCEVVMEVTLNEVIMNLKQISNRYYKGNKFKASDFEQMTLTNQTKVLRETGMGAIREELAPPGDMIDETRVAQGSLPMSAAAKAYWMAHCTGQGRLMAVRAARVDGMRRLAERIKGVAISSQTTVKDFVAESDEINVDMRTFLRGARESGIMYHEDELIVEVEMEVTLRTVLASIKSWAETHYKGDRIKMKQLEEMTVRAKDTVIKETGMGVPPAKYLKQQIGGFQQTTTLATNAPGWINQKLRATGNGAMPEGMPQGQAKLMAFRAAELDARRKLAEQLDGLMITSNTSVKDFVAQNDEIETSMLTFQQGVRVLDDSKKLMEDGTAEVTVEVDLRPLWDMIMVYQRKLSIAVR